MDFRFSPESLPPKGHRVFYCPKIGKQLLPYRGGGTVTGFDYEEGDAMVCVRLDCGENIVVFPESLIQEQGGLPFDAPEQSPKPKYETGELEL